MGSTLKRVCLLTVVTTFRDRLEAERLGKRVQDLINLAAFRLWERLPADRATSGCYRCHFALRSAKSAQAVVSLLSAWPNISATYVSKEFDEVEFKQKWDARQAGSHVEVGHG